MTDIFNNNLPFGGISMMFVVDMLQLKPVRGRFIFQEPKHSAYALHYHDKSLCHNMESVTLRHNHRQGKASAWTKTLQRLSIGEHTDEDIDLLKTRCISKLTKHYPHNALHMY